MVLTPQAPVEEVIQAIRREPAGAHPHNWHLWDNVQEAHRRLADHFLADLAVPADRGIGRGIVTAGGGAHLFPSLWVLLHSLREVGCELPVEVWYKGDQEMDTGMKRLLAPLGATFVDAHKLAQRCPCRILNGWELKPYSVLHSAFREVLFLDADAAPLRDPSFLFMEEAYQASGAVFWPDYPTWNLREEIWRTFGVPVPAHFVPPVTPERVQEHFGRPIPGPYESAIESAQFVIDKGRCWRELRLALWYCEHSDYCFYHFHGDKEALHLAWRKLGTPYGQPSIWPDWHTHTMIQFGFDHQPLIAHRNLDKWRLDGTNKRSGTAPGEERGFRLVEELRGRWGGAPWCNDHPTAAESVVQAKLAGGWFLYRRVGHDERGLELLPDGRVGAGAADRERHWSVFVDGDEALLALCGDDKPTAVLRGYPDGAWRGHWLEYEQMPVELVPNQSEGPAAGGGLAVSPGRGPDVRAGLVNHDRQNRSPETGRATKLRIVMPMLATSEFLVRLTYEALGRIETSAEASAHVLLNGIRGLTVEELQAGLSQHCRVPVELSAGERGVAASWNEGCRRALLDGADYILLMANDALLEPHTIDRLLEFGAAPANRGCAAWSARAINYPPQVDPATVREVFHGCWVTDAADYTCCMLRPETLARHGWFDENYQPAYFEDVDYQVRINQTEDWTATLHAAPMVHDGSATYKNDPESRRRVDAAWAANAQYFATKWGRAQAPTFRSEIRRDCYARPWKDGARALHSWEGPSPGTLRLLYDRARTTPSDIVEHLDVLSRFASTCRHVTEFGTHSAVSTTALLSAGPDKLVCYDLHRHREVTVLEAIAKEPGGRTELHFRQEDVLGADIEPTEMLFIDTLHTYEQMGAELARHAGKVSKYLAFHDTETFGELGERPGTRGIWPAIAEHLRQHPEWRIALHRGNNNGLTVLTRMG